MNSRIILNKLRLNFLFYGDHTLIINTQFVYFFEIIVIFLYDFYILRSSHRA